MSKIFESAEYQSRILDDYIFVVLSGEAECIEWREPENPETVLAVFCGGQQIG